MLTVPSGASEGSVAVCASRGLCNELASGGDTRKKRVGSNRDLLLGGEFDAHETHAPGGRAAHLVADSVKLAATARALEPT